MNAALIRPQFSAINLTKTRVTGCAGTFDRHHAQQQIDVPVFDAEINAFFLRDYASGGFRPVTEMFGGNLLYL